MRGSFFHLQRYSVHDGPGIRTVAFLSGCALRCPWCCNPESRLAGWPGHREVEAAELAAQLMADTLYFLKSGGGVTLSGGEPLLQPEFCREVLTHCRSANVGTAVETCGDIPAAALESVQGLVDVFLFDLKHTDPARHDEATGGNFANILRNLEVLAKAGRTVVLRLPLVPGFNLDQAHAQRVAALAGTLGISKVDLMPHHRLAREKHRELGLSDCATPFEDALATPGGPEALQHFANILQRNGVQTTIGG